MNKKEKRRYQILKITTTETSRARFSGIASGGRQEHAGIVVHPLNFFPFSRKLPIHSPRDTVEKNVIICSFVHTVLWGGGGGRERRARASGSLCKRCKAPLSPGGDRTLRQGLGALTDQKKTQTTCERRKKCETSRLLSMCTHRLGSIGKPLPEQSTVKSHEGTKSRQAHGSQSGSSN